VPPEITREKNSVRRRLRLGAFSAFVAAQMPYGKDASFARNASAAKPR